VDLIINLAYEITPRAFSPIVTHSEDVMKRVTSESPNIPKLTIGRSTETLNDRKMQFGKENLLGRSALMDCLRTLQLEQPTSTVEGSLTSLAWGDDV
jgi:hypothetical protein